MRSRKKNVETGDKSLDKIPNASRDELEKMVDELAEELTMLEGGKEGLERLARMVLDGKVHFGVLDGAALDAALKKAGSEVDIFQMTISTVKCPKCGKKTLVTRRSPPWTWRCLAGRGSDECKSCGYETFIIS